jgi:hypothetical protein
MRTGRLLLLAVTILALILGGSALLGWYDRVPGRAVRATVIMAQVFPWLIGSCAVVAMTGVAWALVQERKKRRK